MADAAEAPLSEAGGEALAAAGELLGLLIRMHEREPDAELIEGLRAIDAAGMFAAVLRGDEGRVAADALAEALRGLAQPLTAGRLDLIAADWADVHVSHGHRASPNGSVWLTQDSLERQQPMFDVRDWYVRYGAEVPNWRARSDDNIVHELQFVAFLLSLGHRRSVQDAGLFLDRHVLPWVPEWGGRVAARAAEPLIAASGLLTAVFVEQLRDLIAAVTGEPRGEAVSVRPAPPPEPEARPFVPGMSESW